MGKKIEWVVNNSTVEIKFSKQEVIIQVITEEIIRFFVPKISKNWSYVFMLYLLQIFITLYIKIPKAINDVIIPRIPIFPYLLTKCPIRSTEKSPEVTNSRQTLDAVVYFFHLRRDKELK